MKFTDPVILFTDDPAEVTAGAYRDDCGRIVPAESDYTNEATGAGSVSPRYATPDNGAKLPTMTEIFSKAGTILNRPPIDLTGWTPEEQHEPWSFVGAHSDV